MHRINIDVKDVFNKRNGKLKLSPFCCSVEERHCLWRHFQLVSIYRTKIETSSEGFLSFSSRQKVFLQTTREPSERVCLLFEKSCVYMCCFGCESDQSGQEDSRTLKWHRRVVNYQKSAQERAVEYVPNVFFSNVCFFNAA